MLCLLSLKVSREALDSAAGVLHVSLQVQALHLQTVGKILDHFTVGDCFLVHASGISAFMPAMTASTSLF